jgi:hypothetical protein
MGDDDGQDDSPPLRARDDTWEPPEKHRATDRFAGLSLRGAQAITDALAQAGVVDDGVVVVDRRAPRRGLGDLERLLDSALEEVEEAPPLAPGATAPHGVPPGPDDPEGAGQTGPR